MKDRSILVVDDDPFMGRLLCDFLQTEGLRATTIGDSRKAIEAFVARSFDLIVTDYNMPVMTGAEFARRVRALDPWMPMCLVTAALGEVSTTDRDLFDGILEKPFESHQLTGMVLSVLSKSDSAHSHVTRPTRYAVDWRVDYIPLASADLTSASLAPRRAELHDISEHGLAFVSEQDPPEERFCAFLIYPPDCPRPSLMVGEVRWTREHDDSVLAGTRSLFWGSERDKAAVIEKAT